MIKKKFTQCKNIFLDSGVIIDLLKIDLSKCDPAVKARIEITRSAIKNFSERPTETQDNRLFQVSAITLAEIFHIDKRQGETIKAISTALSSNQVEIIAFDEDHAIFHNEQFGGLLGNRELEKIKAEVNYPASEYVGIDERIRRDHMIVATAKFNNADVVLTNDGGFQTLCQRYDLFCINIIDDKTFLLSGSGTTVYDFSPTAIRSAAPASA
jgi:hypothetical protein